MGLLTASLGELKPQLWRMAYRGRRVLDVRGMALWLKFRALRRRYNAGFWQRSAEAIGAECTPWSDGFSRISLGSAWTPVRQGEVMLDSRLMLDLMGNKALVYQLMREHGLAVPAHRCFDLASIDEALAFQRATPGLLVVKPASGTGGGNGVTTGIGNAEQLRAAAKLATRFDRSLIVEQQIEGASYRLLFLDGTFIDAIRRDPPCVTGDGRHTIRQLIRLENKRRLGDRPVTALSPLTIDSDCRNWLAETGMSLSARPAAGARVQVKRAVNQNGAGENHVVRDRVHARTIVACERLVKHLGVRLAGIDILARDIARPLGPDNGLISEINTTPGLHHHDLVADPDSAAPVGAIVLRHMFETGSGIVGTASRAAPKQVKAA